MRCRALFLSLVLFAGLVPASLAADDVAGTPRACATRFGAALEAGNARRLASMLPRHGKVKLRLVRLGAEQGSFSAAQVQAVFKDFFKKGSVQSFELIVPNEATEVYRFIRAEAVVTVREGPPVLIGLHLLLEYEETRWVLREIGETER